MTHVWDYSLSNPAIVCPLPGTVQPDAGGLYS
jgi:hypothetical protein